MKRLISSFLLSVAFLWAVPVNAREEGAYVAPDDSLVAARLEQWRDLKFGVIFHWGLYSQAGICESWPICSEDWVSRDSSFTYDSFKRWYWNLSESFAPKEFNPDQWADAVKNAGARYMVFTTKHHDGFCMFDTRYTDFSIANYGLKGDPRADVAAGVFDAFRRQGLWVGAYYSKPDWHCQYFWWDKYATPDRHVNYDLEKNSERWQKYKDFTYNQIEELMTRYGDIDILWLDGGWVATGTREDVDMDRIGGMARSHQPDLLVVDRTVGGKWENYRTPEQMIPAEPYDCPWESCMTLGTDWGYVRNPRYKSVNRVISTLCEVSAKGGALLLGVGPNPDGLIEKDAVDSLAGIGRWLKVNGEAVYATRRAPVYKDGKVWYTVSKDGKYVYAVYGLSDGETVPREIQLECASFAPGGSVVLLDGNRKAKWRKTPSGGVTVILPAKADRTRPVALRLSGCSLSYPYENPDLDAQKRAEDLVSRLSPEQKVSLMLYESPAIPQWGIKKYNWWNEALHGSARNGLATVFPQAIGMAASWDTGLLEKVFDAVSTEQRIKFNTARAKDDVTIYNGLTVWTPNINLFRDPRWGRGQETYGEDPYLTSLMGSAVVRGLQGPEGHKYDKLHACVKHFAVHSGPEYARHRFDVGSLSLRDMKESYLYAFRNIVQKAGVRQVMCAYNAYEGKPCCSSDKLLNGILRNEWGYDGVVVTDCWAVADNFQDYGHNQYPGDPVGAVSASVRSGADLECGNAFGNLVQGVREGRISMEEIDRSARRVMTSRFRLGEMDAPEEVEWSRLQDTLLACRAHGKLALEMARETMTLLRNDGTLPLRKDMKVAVVGPNAAQEKVMWGNYNGTPPYTVSVLEGIRRKVGPQNVVYFKGCDIAAPLGDDAVSEESETVCAELLSGVDAVVFVGGISPDLEGEEMKVPYEGFLGGDRTSIELPSPQREMIKRLAATGKPVVMVNLSGSAVALKPESECCNAILQAWYGGQEGGSAVADVLFGDYNPAGRLPVTFYASDEDLPDYLDYSLDNSTYRYFKGEPLYRFGHGLSYTTFEYSSPSYRDGVMTVTVKNTGSRDGDEVVQIYVSRKSDTDGPVMSLRGFRRVGVKAGESVRVSIPVTFDLYDNESGEMVRTPGEYTLYYGGSSDPALLGSITAVK